MSKEKNLLMFAGKMQVLGHWGLGRLAAKPPLPPSPRKLRL